MHPSKLSFDRVRGSSLLTLALSVEIILTCAEVGYPNSTWLYGSKQTILTEFDYETDMGKDASCPESAFTNRVCWLSAWFEVIMWVGLNLRHCICAFAMHAYAAGVVRLDDNPGRYS